MRSASPSLAALARSYESARKRAPRSLVDLPTRRRTAEAFAKQLKSQGYRFVGPTSVYAFMQNVGVVNDHIPGCFQPRLQPRSNQGPTSCVTGDQRLPNELGRLATWVPRGHRAGVGLSRGSCNLPRRTLRSEPELSGHNGVATRAAGEASTNRGCRSTLRASPPCPRQRLPRRVLRERVRTQLR